jgi:hypothetical protein
MDIIMVGAKCFGGYGLSKFMVYTDLHLTAKRPIHRIDNFEASMIEKLAEVYRLAKEHSVDAVLFMGDFFNSHRVFAYDLINNAMDVVCSADITTYAIVGQHDLVGRNQDSYASSTLCFMERHCPKFYTLKAPKDFGDCVVYPCHTWDDFQVQIQATDITKRKKSILLAHHLITRDKKVFPTYVADEFLPCPYSAVLFGDYHGGMEPYQKDNTLVWSPGAMARLAINEADRVIKCGVLTVGKTVEVDEIPLASMKPSGEVMGKGFLETVREHAGMVDATTFVSKVMSLEADSKDIYDLVEKAALQQGIRKEVIDYVLSKRP